MNNYYSTTFGKMNLDQLAEYYEVAIKYKEKTVDLDLNFETTSIEKADMLRIDEYLADLGPHETQIRKWLEADFAAKGFSAAYAEYYLNAWEEEEIAELLRKAKPSTSQSRQIFSLVHLSRIGFYPNPLDEVLAIFDYTLDQELTDQILVVGVRKDGSYFITVES